MYFDGARETMVLDPLGTVALEGIRRGCDTLRDLESYSRQSAIAYDDETLRLALITLIDYLVSLEIIEPIE